jgi:RNA polymerase sigma-70 factor, ECF subfamily
MNNNISLLKDGNQEAFKQFLEENYHSFLRYGSLFIDDFDEIKDIVQEVVIYIWEHRQSIRSDLSLTGYVKQGIKNRCINYIKHRKVVTEHQQTEINESFGEDEQENEILLLKLKDALQKLPPKCREVLLLNIENDLSYTEIAQHLNISVNTVKDHMKNAYKQLREA